MTPVIRKGFLKQYVKVSIATGASLKVMSRGLGSCSAFLFRG